MTRMLIIVELIVKVGTVSRIVNAMGRKILPCSTDWHKKNFCGHLTFSGTSEAARYLFWLLKHLILEGRCSKLFSRDLMSIPAAKRSAGALASCSAFSSNLASLQQIQFPKYPINSKRPHRPTLISFKSLGFFNCLQQKINESSIALLHQFFWSQSTLCLTKSSFVRSWEPRVLQKVCLLTVF